MAVMGVAVPQISTSANLCYFHLLYADVLQSLKSVPAQTIPILHVCCNP